MKKRLLRNVISGAIGKLDGVTPPMLLPWNMHDVEVALNLLDKRIEEFREDVDVMKFDSHRDDILGMPKQVVEDAVFASFDVHFHKYRAFRAAAGRSILDGRAVVLVCRAKSVV